MCGQEFTVKVSELYAVTVSNMMKGVFFKFLEYLCQILSQERAHQICRVSQDSVINRSFQNLEKYGASISLRTVVSGTVSTALPPAQCGCSFWVLPLSEPAHVPQDRYHPPDRLFSIALPSLLREGNRTNAQTQRKKDLVSPQGHLLQVASQFWCPKQQFKEYLRVRRALVFFLPIIVLKYHNLLIQLPHSVTLSL